LKYKVIIPARGGSKRFPGKNVYPLNGIPLIAYSILYAKQFDFFDIGDVWVNTDDEDIGKISAEYGSKVFIRSKELGGDTIESVKVLKEQVEYMLSQGEIFDAVVLLQPTNPLRPKDLLQDAITIFERESRTSLATFSTLNKKFGKIREHFFIPDNYIVGQRSQDVPPDYFENGLLYITRNSELLCGRILGLDVYPMVLDHPFANVDIDEPLDVLYAEFLLNIFK
jgi:CMP-N-acetylneuraminic acid synthetase